MDNYQDIKQQFVDGEIGYDKWLPVRENYLAYIDNIAFQENRNLAGLAISKELGDTSSFAASPVYFESIIPSLVEKGVIGFLPCNSVQIECCLPHVVIAPHA